MKKASRGFSLIELMIAVTLGMLAVAAVGSVFIYGSRNYKQDDRISRMQDEMRFAMTQISQDIEMADFWAQVTNPQQNVALPAAGLTSNPNCGPSANWMFAERSAGLATIGNATAAQANAQFPCIATGEFHPATGGTDILAIKRLHGSSLGPTEGTVNQVYLRTNGIQSLLYLAPAGELRTTGPAPTGDNVTLYQFRPSVWYLRNFTNTAGDGAPCLARKSIEIITGQVNFRTDCIAAGIENLQFEFGFDNDGNGVADRFVEFTAGQVPTAAQLARVVAIRVHLLARALEPDPDAAYRNTKTYQVGGQTIDMSTRPVNEQRYYRRTLSSLVVLRNQSYRQSPFALPST